MQDPTEVVPLGRELVRPGLRLIFCGINPGLKSAAQGYPFANPGNRFWAAIYAAGFTRRQLRPSEAAALLEDGIGLTRLVDRPTRRADELTLAELQDGGARLTEIIAAMRPLGVALLGVSAYRAAFRAPAAQIGRQPAGLAGAALWILPNPSGLNAHYTLAGLTTVYRACREELAELERGRDSLAH